MSPEDFLEVFQEVEDSYSVRIPTYVSVSRKNIKAVNLNIYRNLHHHHLNTQKKNFEDEVMPLLKDKPRAERVWIHYTVFASRNGRLDTMNIGSIADKYFSDTMVNAGCIPDDNTDHIVLSTFSFGGLSSMDGHIIATVYILKNKDPKNMRILLDQDDIQQALNQYVKTLQFPNADKSSVSISIEDNEIIAEVVIGDAVVKSSPKKVGRPRKQPQSDVVEEDDSDVAESTENGNKGSSSDVDSGGGESTEDDSESPKESTKVSKQGNLFSDEEESQSSDSDNSQKEKSDSTPKGKTTLIKSKKPSIFDVD